jgi:hypothetical protein
MTTTWSVRLEANSFGDDTFNGTYDECLKYCSEYDYNVNWQEAVLAEIELDGSGSVVFTHDLVTEL